MRRRDFVHISAATALTPTPWWRRAVEQHRWEGYDNAIVVDALGGIGDRRGYAGVDVSAAALGHIRRSGVTAVNVTLGTVGNGANLFRDTVADLDRWDDRVTVRYPQVLDKILTTADLRLAKRNRHLGVIYGFQDGAMLEGDLRNLDVFHESGVRIIQLTYNRRNDLGDGSLEPENRGLTVFGRSVVERMNELGMLVDLSHCGQRTTADGIRHSAVPVSITHSGCLALSSLPRNKGDDDMRALAERGGVFGVYFMPFLRERGQANADDVIRHLEHALNVCGEDHVGIGTDGSISPVPLTDAYREFIRQEIARRRAAGISAPGETDDVVPLIPDLNDPRRLEHLADRLAERGHGSTRIEKVLGRNFLRLMSEVWQA